MTLTFFSLLLVNASNVELTEAQKSIYQNLVPGSDVVIGDNWSPFDLQIYGKYYESLGAAQLQPQKTKRMVVNGALVDFEYDGLQETSIIPVPDAMKVVLAPQRHQTTLLYDDNSTQPTGSVTETSTGVIYNGAKRTATDAQLENDLRDRDL